MTDVHQWEARSGMCYMCRGGSLEPFDCSRCGGKGHRHRLLMEDGTEYAFGFPIPPDAIAGDPVVFVVNTLRGQLYRNELDWHGKAFAEDFIVRFPLMTCARCEGNGWYSYAQDATRHSCLLCKKTGMVRASPQNFQRIPT